RLPGVNEGRAHQAAARVDVELRERDPDVPPGQVARRSEEPVGAAPEHAPEREPDPEREPTHEPADERDRPGEECVAWSARRAAEPAPERATRRHGAPSTSPP